MPADSTEEVALPYLQILETAPDAMVVVDRSGHIVFVNQQTEKLFGRGRAQLRGQALETLIPPRFHKGHKGHLERYFSQPGTRPMGSGIALFGQRADGLEFPIEVSLSPVEADGRVLVSAAIRDVSERKRMEAAAKIAAERLAGAVESLQDPVAVYDPNQTLILCNSAFRAFTVSIGLDEPVGRTRHQIREFILSSAVIAGDDQSGAEGTGVATVDLRFRDGRFMRGTTRATSEGGAVQTFWDLTQDAQREEDLRAARAAADSANAAKSEFLSSMSHELRTPLNAILGFAQLLLRDRREPIPARHGERAERIIKGGEHLLRLIDDILDLSRIEAGGIFISTEPVSIGGVLDELRATLHPIVLREGISLEMKTPPPDLPKVSVDRTRLVQILMNFGSNAIKYNRKHGVVSFVVSSPDPSRVRVTVADSGNGIPLDKQEKLFQPFQRAGQETGPIEGTGIGLVITKRLAELMGGRVGFSSKPGVGSEFWVEVPTHVSKEEVAPLPHKRPPLVSAMDGERVILYVEDNPDNVAFMRDVMSLFQNIELAVEPTAELGVERARTLRPQAIIMDINLPGMSGVAALKALQALDETKSIPVIALTAAASNQDRRVGIDAGFFRYLTKPVKIDELEDALSAVFAPTSGRG